jgi:lipoprotein-anchoring transpeptidase ErfK/SrfK
MAAAGTSLLVTMVALLGATGVLPMSTPSYAAPTRPEPASGSADATLASAEVRTAPQRAETLAPAPAAASTALPPESGHGKRVVFDISAQRVWLVSRHEEVRRTYLVSGSVSGNLDPGSYEVYSRSRHAIGVDDSGTMEYMVRFAAGDEAAIGFHDIPVRDGKPVQTRAELGTPQSHGCIRQWRPDARALWRFAPVGTRVVVVA